MAYFLPFVIMGGSSVVVGILAFLLPETRGRFILSLIYLQIVFQGCELPATVEEAMALGNKKEKEAQPSQD